jgi:hypothetical protein
MMGGGGGAQPFQPQHSHRHHPFPRQSNRLWICSTMVEARAGTDMETVIEKREVWWEDGRAGEAERVVIGSGDKGKSSREGRRAVDGGNSMGGE